MRTSPEATGAPTAFRRNAKVRLWPIPASSSAAHAAATGPRVSIRVAASGGAMSGSQSQPAALRRQAEDTAVLWTIEASIEPARQIRFGAKRRQPFVIDCGEHGAANH